MSDKDPTAGHFARILRLARDAGLPGLDQAAPAGTDTLEVSGEAFLSMLDARTAVLHCPVDQKVLLMEISPDIYFETDLYVGQEAMLINLEKIDDEELSLRLRDAWTFRAPEHLKRN